MIKVPEGILLEVLIIVATAVLVLLRIVRWLV